MFTFEFPQAQLEGIGIRAQSRLRQGTRDLLEVMGVSLLANVKTAYIAKSRGAKGEDGIKWDSITAQTLLQRLRRSGTIKPTKAKGVYVVKKGNKENAALLTKLARIKAIKGVARNKKGERFGTGSQIAVRKQNKDASKNVAPSGAYQIGVDTGLQLNTLQPGYQGSGGSSIEYDNLGVTVGAAMNYSEYFDKWRPIIPEVLPEKWIKELEDLIQIEGTKIVQDAINRRQ
jgi:hypothetical protein